MTFRKLIDDARRRGRAPHLKPRTMKWAAARCGIHLSHVYNLIDGVKVPNDWTVARIAKGLGLKVSVVERALAASRKGAA